MTNILTTLLNRFWRFVRWSLRIAQKRAPYACDAEVQEANYPNQEHHQNDAAQYFDSDDDVIVKTPIHDNDKDSLARERENCTV